MKYVLPRLVYANRGDLASRWGLIKTLHSLGAREVTVYCQHQSDVPRVGYTSIPFGRFYGLLHSREGWKALRAADTVLWSVGLDLQDDSSLAKLLYLWASFALYRSLGLRVWCLFQGAGPIDTALGRWLATQVLRNVELFVARDPQSADLITRLGRDTKVLTAHDAIFLPGFEDEIHRSDACNGEYSARRAGHVPGFTPKVGVNLRQWFHFRSSVVPYEFARHTYRKRSEKQMQRLVERGLELVHYLRSTCHAAVTLLSAYEPGTARWEDDLPWLRMVKAGFGDDPDVLLVDRPMPLPGYFSIVSGLDLMISMRLHSSLIALRYGVPAINLSYTLKGISIMHHMGLGRNVFDLSVLLEQPGKVADRASQILAEVEGETRTVERAVSAAIDTNLSVLRNLITV